MPVAPIYFTSTNPVINYEYQNALREEVTCDAGDRTLQYDNGAHDNNDALHTRKEKIQLLKR
jgi:hypothetical protein